MTAELLLEPGIGGVAADHPICPARTVLLPPVAQRTTIGETTRGRIA
jgi:hypothetical protein